MKYFDENGERINVSKLKIEFESSNDKSEVTEEEIIKELENAYQKGNASITKMANFSADGIGGNILEKIKQFVCKFIGPNSSSEDVIDAVLDALMTILPGGFILKPLAKKLAKFIINKGIGAFCNV